MKKGTDREKEGGRSGENRFVFESVCKYDFNFPITTSNYKRQVRCGETESENAKESEISKVRKTCRFISIEQIFLPKK